MDLELWLLAKMRCFNRIPEKLLLVHTAFNIKQTAKFCVIYYLYNLGQ